MPCVRTVKVAFLASVQVDSKEGCVAKVRAGLRGVIVIVLAVGMFLYEHYINYTGCYYICEIITQVKIGNNYIWNCFVVVDILIWQLLLIYNVNIIIWLFI